MAPIAPARTKYSVWPHRRGRRPPGAGRPAAAMGLACGEDGAGRSCGSTRPATRAYARRRRSMRRSSVMSSSPLGVSRIFITPANRGSRMMRRNGSGPSEPSAMSSCRSRRESNGVFESLRCRQREAGQADRVLPPAPDAVVVAHAGRSPPSRGGRCRRRRRCGGGRQLPTASRSRASSSNVLPSDVPGARGRFQQHRHRAGHGLGGSA